MSHMTNIKTNFVDAESIKKAAAKLFPNCKVIENGEVRGWAGRSQQADIVIQAPAGNSFDVGFNKNSEGNYDCVTDFYGAARWTGREGQFTDKFKQAYNVEKVKKEVAYMGHYATETVLDDGTVQFEIDQY